MQDDAEDVVDKREMVGLFVLDGVRTLGSGSSKIVGDLLQVSYLTPLTPTTPGEFTSRVVRLFVSNTAGQRSRHQS